MAYDSFGNVTSGSASTRYTYTGREFDSDTGLIYYRARWYDSQQGRFVSEDPVGFQGGINWYSYVANDPLDNGDPLGLAKCKDPKYCRKLLQNIISKTGGFLNNFRPYRDSGFVDRGDKPWSHGGESGLGKGPGQHYNNLLNRQRGLIRDIVDYLENCIDDGDPPPPALKRGIDASKIHIPWPVNIPTVDELRLQEESNRYMEEVWTDILKGSLYGGAVYLGLPPLIRALPALLNGLGRVPIRAPAH